VLREGGSFTLCYLFISGPPKRDGNADVDVQERSRPLLILALPPQFLRSLLPREIDFLEAPETFHYLAPLTELRNVCDRFYDLLGKARKGSEESKGKGISENFRLKA